jgi:hypothetical protein
MTTRNFRIDDYGDVDLLRDPKDTEDAILLAIKK